MRSFDHRGTEVQRLAVSIDRFRSGKRLLSANEGKGGKGMRGMPFDCRVRSALTAIKSSRQDDEDEADDRRGSVRDHGRRDRRTMCSWPAPGGCRIAPRRLRPSRGSRCSRRRRRRRRRRGKDWTACECTRSPAAVANVDVVLVLVLLVAVAAVAASRVAAGMGARTPLVPFRDGAPGRAPRSPPHPDA